MSDAADLLGTLKRIERGQDEPRTAVSRCRERAKTLQRPIQAFAFLPDLLAEPEDGPLAGIAVGVKDLIDTADMPTAYGSVIYAGHRPAADAAIVARLRGLGATVLGKTVTTEFAWQQPGPTRHPWNPAHTPGGSSSGSAAAVAAGIVPLALGTQTVGSVIRPAAFCGIVGFKPTFGTLPRDGVHPLSVSLDHVGVFTRSVHDAAFVLGLLTEDPRFAEALAGGRASDAGPTAARPRLKLLPADDPAIEPAQRAAFERALQTLRDGGFTIEAIHLPDSFTQAYETVDTLLAYDAAQEFQALVADRGDAVGLPIRTLVARGQAVSEAGYLLARARQSNLRAAFDQAMEGVDALLTVPAAGEAPEGLASTGNPRFCAPWSLIGVPALTFPIGHGPSGLPLGLQVIGRAGEDAALLRVGAALAALFPPVATAPG